MKKKQLYKIFLLTFIYNFIYPLFPSISYPLIQINNIPQNLIDEKLFTDDKQKLIKGINHSLSYLETAKAKEVYENYPLKEFSRERVIASLKRFRQLLISAKTPQQLQASVEREFVFYKSVGNDNQGRVDFTGYFQPLYPASRQKTDVFRYPLYRKPSNFDSWQTPHPSRKDLEGKDGLGNNSLIKGYELVWLRDRLQAYLVQVQGSAQLRLTDGTIMTIGYDGATDYPYTSLGKELINDGKIPAEEMSLPRLMAYLENNPDELEVYLPRNNRFIFFTETKGKPATGSLNVPVTDERSIATDKNLMPPGGLALIYTRIPQINQNKELITPMTARYVLDQDTGSAIKGAGRVDIYFGTGDIAKSKAGLVDWEGELYYLLLK
ncbi:MltA domain-containing protein [Cyanobacterium aponinum FACHB-4101]|uniref:murein transglycosylase A n=1 Tax=Cyanobacterium aponinum TaxID=379064 RepID=UPI001680C88D|nr:MltA domain-containing protein [Cyanobacterium aponinum]MBD2395586.1 MltA domain-containing protein [Cyanobacterium aponinum FACHB-4101]